MTKRTQSTPKYVRKTLTCTGTISSPVVDLDQKAALAVAYARKWFNTGPGQTGVDPRPSGIVRRALQCYMQFLASSDLDDEHEARAIRRCCSAIPADLDAWQAALQRIATADAIDFPQFAEVLHGPEADNEWDAFDAKVQASLDAIASSPWGRIRGLKFDAEDEF